MTAESSATAIDNQQSKRAWLAFNGREFAGGLGDLGTFLPLSLGVSIACGLDFGLIVLLAGLMNIATGVAFGQPIPVQPMKAVAAIAIAEGLTSADVRWAGLWMSAMLLAIACLPHLNTGIQRVPRAWIAALQAGIGLKLAWLGVTMIAALPTVELNGSMIAAAILAILTVGAARVTWLLPSVVALGAVYALALADTSHADAVVSNHGNGNKLSPVWSGFLSLALPQLPLTLLNSVVAVCALSAAYFPNQGISPRRMTASVGLMNAVATPLGGMPMCHGAGGLAAQYHFGARTGGSVVMLGVAKVVLVVAFWPWLGDVLAGYPFAVLAPLLIIAGVRLAYAGRPAWQGADRWSIAIGALSIACLGTLIGVVITVALFLLVRGIVRPTQSPPDPSPT